MMKTEIYVVPEIVIIDIESESVLCGSPTSGGFIDDFEKIPGTWD